MVTAIARAVALGEVAGGGLELGRAHVVRGRVDEVAGQRLGAGQPLDQGRVDAVGRDEACAPAGRGVLVAAEAVALEQPAERRLAQAASPSTPSSR